MNLKNRLLIPILLAGILTGAAPGAPERDLQALQTDFQSWKFGMFIHFGMATYIEGGWSTGKEDPLLFNPTKLDCGQWLDAAVAAKMKYAVLTAKHTGGWCLWDSATTKHDISALKNYKNGKGDIVKEFVVACRARDLKVGLYYCFPLGGSATRWPNYLTLPDEGYADGTADALGIIKTHMTELLTNYGAIDMIWIDQASTRNGGLKPGDWLRIKAHIHALQPACLVSANNAKDFQQTDLHGYEYPWALVLPPADNAHPAETNDKLNQGWFAIAGKPTVPVRDLDYVVNRMLRPLNDRNANYLLNCAPGPDGLLHEDTVALLKRVGETWDPKEPSQAGHELYGIQQQPVKHVPTAGKQVALGFGPEWSAADMTAAADILKKRQIKATFFVNEATAKSEKETLRRLVAAGHELGNGSKSDATVAGLANARLVRDEIDCIRTQLHTIQSPTFYRAPGDRYDEFVWSVLNYQGLTAVAPTEEPDPGAIIAVESIDGLKEQLGELKAKQLESVTLKQLFASSTSPRLQAIAKGSGAEVVTGRE
jgi:alpha-L-fucosidase